MGEHYGSASNLPNFLLVGAPRSGTTSLADYLGQHPDVYMSPVKEPGFFARELLDLPGVGEKVRADAASLREYLDGPMTDRIHERFVVEWGDYRKLFKNVRGETAIGEASASYLASPGAPAQIAERCPVARIIMILRDPIDRMFSNYMGAVAAGATKWPFWMWARQEIDNDKRTFATFGVYSSSLYSSAVQRYLERFPRERISIHIYEDFAQDPAAVVRELFTHLGVDPSFPVDTSRRLNSTLIARGPAMLRRPLRAAARILPGGIRASLRQRAKQRLRMSYSQEDRARLLPHFQHDLRALGNLIGRDLSAWLG